MKSDSLHLDFNFPFRLKNVYSKHLMIECVIRRMLFLNPFKSNFRFFFHFFQDRVEIIDSACKIP